MTPNRRAPGHQAILRDSSDDYLVFHACEGGTDQSELKISTVVCADGWPRVAAVP